jgi:hypothetical protein
MEILYLLNLTTIPIQRKKNEIDQPRTAETVMIIVAYRFAKKKPPND